MDFKFLLLALALLGAVSAEYDYHRNANNNNNNNNNSNPKVSDVNSLEQHDSSSSEEYRTNYQTPQNNADNSEATPKGYDYSDSNSSFDANSNSNSDSSSDSNVLHDVTSSAAAATALFPVPLPVLREQRQPEIFPPASYSYNYAVNDESSGDIKDHSETRDGYVVRGSYSLIDPDGFKRTVTYTADNIHGFNAVVNRVPYVFKKLTVVAPSVPLDERSSAALVSAAPSASASAAGSALVKGGVENSSSAGYRDSYVSAAHDRDTTGGIYA